MSRVKDLKDKNEYKIEDLEEIIEILRGENGCPWDRRQTHSSIRKNILEEAYEVAEAIDDNNISSLKEELGDLLMQIVFHSDIEKDNNNFNLTDVISDVCRKLIVRHPHVFGDKSVDSEEEVLKNWDEIKRETKGQSSVYESLKTVPRLLPQLMRAQKIQSRVKKGGHDVKDLLKYKGLLGDESINKENIGEILFYIANKASENDIDCEEALEKANNDFINKFKKIEEI